MIVRTHTDLEALDSIASDKKWSSARYLLKKDGMGFSLHETIVEAARLLDTRWIGINYRLFRRF